MARKRYTAEQIIGYLRQAEVLLGQGRSLAEVVRTLEVTANTYYRWRKEYGGLGLDQARRLAELSKVAVCVDHVGDATCSGQRAVEQENGRLKRAVANLTLDNLILKEVTTGKF